MKEQLTEVKRMQQLAGIISEANSIKEAFNSYYVVKKDYSDSNFQKWGVYRMVPPQIEKSKLPKDRIFGTEESDKKEAYEKADELNLNFLLKSKIPLDKIKKALIKSYEDSSFLYNKKDMKMNVMNTIKKATDIKSLMSGIQSATGGKYSIDDIYENIINYF